MTLPPYATRELILERLPFIFKEGTPNRQYVVREMAASTIFSMLYFGAVEGNDVYIAPLHVYRMTFEQAALSEDQDRLDSLEKSRKKGFQPEGKRWYADLSREPIRDESLREGLVNIGAVAELPGLATTSAKPRYYLKKDFAALFNPLLTDDDLELAIDNWQELNLSSSAIARMKLASQAANQFDTSVMITLANGETRRISAGPSSQISKSVIEIFAKKFLARPALLWLSVSDDKISDDKLAKAIGLDIKADKNLPDLILVDLGPAEPIILFVEVVATDGAISHRRQEALYKITDAAGFKRNQVAFLTAYADRQSAGFTKTIRDLAWNSFVWFVSEPYNLVYWSEGNMKLSEFMI